MGTYALQPAVAGKSATDSRADICDICETEARGNKCVFCDIPICGRCEASHLRSWCQEKPEYGTNPGADRVMDDAKGKGAASGGANPQDT
eukprot:8407404-Karenia_brevis.AAC.1